MTKQPSRTAQPQPPSGAWMPVGPSSTTAPPMARRAAFSSLTKKQMRSVGCQVVIQPQPSSVGTDTPESWPLSLQASAPSSSSALDAPDAQRPLALTCVTSAWAQQKGLG